DRGRSGQVFPRPVSDEVHAGAGQAGEVPGQGVVGTIHTAKRGEVAADEQPGMRHASPRFRAAPWRAPLRNQYCRPIWVVKGVKLKVNASVPALMTKTATAHKRRSRAAALLASLKLSRVLSHKAPP